MFGKITRHHVQHHFNKAKEFIGNAYHHTKNFLGDIDSGVRTFKHVYGALAPVLESYGVNSGNRHVMKALTGYDNVRNQVMEGHDRVMNDYNNVKDTLAKTKVNFDFA